MVSWVNPIVFGNNRLHKTTDMGDNVRLKPVFWVSFSPYGVFWGKNLRTVFGIPFLAEKIIFIFIIRRTVRSKMVMHPKNYFSRLFWKILHFLEKIVKWKIFKTSFPTKKGCVDFCCQTPPIPQNGYVLSQVVFRIFPQKYCFFRKTCFIIKYRVLILWQKRYIQTNCLDSQTQSLNNWI